MERLTDKAQSNCGFVWCIKIPYSAQDAVDRLAAYEDTGLMPERVAKLTQAEKDGPLAVLPPNAPLTWKQLREMDGQPVWVVFRCGTPIWALVDVYPDSVRLVNKLGRWVEFQSEADFTRDCSVFSRS